MARLFLSHTGDEIDEARRLAERLEHDGHQVFLAGDGECGLGVGEVREPRLYREIRCADPDIALVIHASAGSPRRATERGAVAASADSAGAMGRSPRTR